MDVSLDDVLKLSGFSNINQNNDEFTVSIEKDKYYTFYGTWSHFYSAYDFSVEWSYFKVTFNLFILSKTNIKNHFILELYSYYILVVLKIRIY